MHGFPFILLLLPSALVCMADPADPAQPAPPRLTTHTVFRPTFLTRDFSMTSGTAFMVQKESQGNRFLVTAHHLFGPAGGLEDQLSGSAVPSVFLRAVGLSFDRDLMVIATDEGIPIADARQADDNGSERDIAAFRIRGWSPMKSLSLLDRPAQVGETVWVVLRDVIKDDVKLAEGIVAWVSEREVRYRLKDYKLNYSGASGAPVLTKTGEVIGMHLGLFSGRSGQLFGFGTPSTAILEVLPDK